MIKFLFLFSLFFLTGFVGNCQSDVYSITSAEMIFSSAKVNDLGQKENAPVRYAPVFNVQTIWCSDRDKHFGVFGGLALCNVGYIYDKYRDYRNTVPPAFTYETKKFSSYNLGIPFGFKYGILRKFFFYGGYEIEFPIHYKEKTFSSFNGNDKIGEWFSNRETGVQHSFYAGLQFHHAISLKFKYYISNFHNDGFEENNRHQPYRGLKANIFYLSLCVNLLKDFEYVSPFSKKR